MHDREVATNPKDFLVEQLLDDVVELRL